MSLPQNDHQSKTNPGRRALIAPQITQCTCLTGTGRSAIAVVAVRGPDAQRILKRCSRLAVDQPASVGQVRLGHWTGPDATQADLGTNQPTTNHPDETVVITAITANHWEIHCHGGTAAIERILADLQQCGAQRVREINSKSPLVITEAEAVLSRCLTEKTAAVALAQVRGALLNWALQWQSQPTSPEILAAAKSEAQTILRSADWTMRIAEPWKIVLVGKPNVGKSSLLNALVGFDRSITFNQAGTTRDVLHTETVIAGVPVRLSDTAGIRDGGEPIEAEGMRRALHAAYSADLVIQVEDATSQKPVDFSSFHSSVPQIRVLNKVDLVKSGQALSENDVATSAMTGVGIDALVMLLGQKLLQFAPKPGAPVVLNQRQRDLMTQIATSSLEFPLAATLQALIGGALQ
ncbi:50S ribosome-binding GTPase [Rubripirellula sp.]|nr:50S ribosome-binding GTPase [Rubripirellula sp.]